MRFVLAIVLFVVAFCSIGLGVAQRTVLLGPSSVSLETQTEGTAPITLIDGATLNARPGSQGVTLDASGPIFMAYGRTADVLGWVGDASYAEIGYDQAAETLTATEHHGIEQTVPAPENSDLWLTEYTGTDELTRRINVPVGVTVIVLADGTSPAPADVTINWPLDNSTPWAGPLVLGGLVVLALGLVAFVWALVHARRGRGPRRKPPKQPKLPRPPKPKPLRALASRPALTGGPKKGRRRAFSAIGGLAIGAIALTGCSIFEPEALPTPEPAVTLPADTDAPPPAVSKAQFNNQILPDVLEVVAEADEKRDATLLATRFDGPALQLRAANYKVRGIDSKLPAIAPFPQGAVNVLLPQAYDGWPRTVFAVIEPDSTDEAPVALMLTQPTARENYKVRYAISLEPEAEIKVPLTEDGAPVLDGANSFGALPPDALATAYGDLLIKGAESEYASYFDSEGDSLQAAIGAEKKKERAAAVGPSARMTFANVPGDGGVIAFGTSDAGQIVAVELDDSETVKPREQGAAINPSGAVKALSGKSQTTRGIVATYGLQLLFYIPPVAESTQKIVLLGFAQGLVDAREVK